MLQTAIGFTLGVLFFQNFPDLPSPWWLLLFVPAVVAWWKLSAIRFLPALLCGVLWSLGSAWVTRPAEIPPLLLGQDLQITGHIEQIPKNGRGSTAFLFRTSNILHAGRRYQGRWLLRLSWYNTPPDLTAGDRWQLRVRLKQSHGFMNPGGFDFEGWLYARGVKYTGYVRGLQQRRLGSSPGLHRLRQAISTELATNIISQRAAAVVRALVVGDRSGLESADKGLFATTGTSHLMAISGLHVGLVAGLLYALMRGLWRRMPLLCRRWPANVAAAPVALSGALLYSALAGFSVPTQRALIMLSLAMLALLSRHRVKPLHTLSLALLLVAAWDPLTIISAGFWLSFAAVAVILFAAAGQMRFQWLKIQFMVALGLLPILLVYQMDVALLSPLVNILAIPLFGLVIVPVVLLSSLLLFVWPAVAVGVFAIAAELILFVLDGLQFVADLSPQWQASGALPLAAMLFWVSGLGLLLAPRGLPGRWLGVPMLLPLLLPVRQSIPFGEFHFTLLDVGQGLSAVVETSHHTLVYDTGPKYRSGFETGSQVVVPYLRYRGVDFIDFLLLSHGDVDHTGGTQGLLSSVKVAAILAGEPAEIEFDLPLSRCVAGRNWQWDGVRFAILYPAEDAILKGNDASCVLKISNSAGSVLLTGDVEAGAERQLVQNAGSNLKVDVVVAPHHGSASSSSPVFVSATEAEYVLYSAGYLNRWGFPNEQVAQRWTAAGANALSTAQTGALHMHFHRQGFTQPLAYRGTARAWYHHP